MSHHPVLPHARLHELVEAQSRRSPAAIAVVAGTRGVTYARLDAMANGIARQLRNRAVGRESLVGVCLDRDEWLLAALLGVLKAGAAYVPLDPSHPPERLGFICSDAGLSLVVTARGALDHAGATGVETLVVEEVEPYPQAPDVPGDPGDAAYVIYTSGSTGQPKGVVVEHRNAVNLITSESRFYSRDELRGVLASTSVCFDPSITQLFLTLSVGGTVIMAPDILALPTLPARGEVTLVNGVPSALAVLLESPLPRSVRTIVSGGEPLTRAVADRVLATPGVQRLVNLYGPTECTVSCVGGDIASGDGVPSIGRAYAGAELSVRDTDGNPVPADAVGELWVGGPGVARGYLGRPDLTTARFGSPPAGAPAGGHYGSGHGVPQQQEVTNRGDVEPGSSVDWSTGRAYRTGDLVRVDADGSLHFCGRVDDQVKVRGHRVEPGEVEAVLAAHPRITAATVVPTTGGDGLTALAGFFVAKRSASATATAPDAAELRAYLGARLPAYLVPSKIIRLERLPTTPNGKVDRAALTAMTPVRLPAATPRTASPRTATPRTATPRTASPRTATPRTAAEAVVAAIWSEVLGVDVGCDEAFDALGGHSLHAARIAARLERDFGVRVPVGRVLGPITVAQVAAFVETSEPARGAHPLRRSAGADAPVTAVQRRYWFLDQYIAKPGLYDVHSALDIDGEIAPERLATALSELVERHHALRTAITLTPAGLRQRTVPAVPVELPILDLPGASAAEADTALAALADRPFDLSTGHLVRAALARTGHGRWRLLLGVHHIAIDGRSLDVLLDDLSACYNGTTLDEPALRYADVAAWEAELPREDALDYWRQQLREAPSLLTLPTGRPRPPEPTYAGGVVTRPLPAELLDRVDGFARQEGASRFMALLAALSALLSRHAGETDVVIGAPVANRPRPELDVIVGCLVNTVALRCDLDGRPTFRELLARTRRTALDAYEHEALPFERVVEELRLPRHRSHTPLFQAMLVVQQPAVTSVPLGDATLRLAGEHHGDRARFDLTFVVDETADGPDLTIQYSADLFEASTATRLADQLCRLLAEATAHPDTPVDELPLLSAHERAKIVALGRGPAAHGERRPVHELVAVRAAAEPDRIAVAMGSSEVTYGELNSAANQVAWALRARDVGRDTPVAVRLRRSPAAVVAMLGIAKAGGCFVPVDPDLPAARADELLADVRPALVIDTELLRGLDVDRSDDPPPLAGPDDLAHVFCTSGSTGRPKGVLATHGGLTNLVLAKADRFDVRPDSRTLQYVSFGFEVSVSDVYMTLDRGLMLGQFHPLPPAEGGLWNPDFRPLRSPVPLLAIRQMVPSDLPFLTGEVEFLDSYLRVFRDRLNDRQRAEADDAYEQAARGRAEASSSRCPHTQSLGELAVAS